MIIWLFVAAVGALVALAGALSLKLDEPATGLLAELREARLESASNWSPERTGYVPDEEEVI